MGETPAPDVTRVERPASRPSDWESVGKEHRGQVRRPSPKPSRVTQRPVASPPTTDTVQPPMWLKSNGQQAVPPTGSQWAKSIGVKYAQAITRRNASPPTDTAPAPQVKGSRETEGRTRQVTSRRQHLTTDPRPKYLPHSPTSEKDVTLTKHLRTS